MATNKQLQDLIDKHNALAGEADQNHHECVRKMTDPKVPQAEKVVAAESRPIHEKTRNEHFEHARQAQILLSGFDVSLAIPATEEAKKAAEEHIMELLASEIVPKATPTTPNVAGH